MNPNTDELSRGSSNFVLYAFAGILTGAYLADIGLPKIFSYIPEFSSAAACALIAMLAVRNGFAPVRTAIWIVIGLLAMQVLFGLIANKVQVGTAIIGARIYLTSLPFFLLPIVAIPSAKDLRNQFRLLLVVGAIQLPIAVEQKLATMARDTTSVRSLTSGDHTYGTLMNSAMLSVFLICLSAVIFSAYLRKRLTIRATILFLGVMLFPTTINSTKATIFLIPIALLLPVLFMPSDKRRTNAFAAVVILAVFMTSFVSIHDHLVAPRWGYGILDFLTMEGRVEGYLKKDAEIGTTEEVGRIDSLILPFEAFKRDPVKLILGLGMGSVTESTFGDLYTGQYNSRYGNLLGPTASRLLWETGCLGLLLVTILLILVFDEARRSRFSEDSFGVLAHSWLAVVPLMFVTMFYKDVMNHPTLGAVFWYYCGTIVAIASRKFGHEPRNQVHFMP